MKKPLFSGMLSVILCVVLVAAIALFTAGCQNEPPESQVKTTVAESAALELMTVGEGENDFTFIVVDADGNETGFHVYTDETTVGAALMKLSLIAGEDGPYGLYVKTVNGKTLDYDKDSLYWAFYVNDAYASAGVDTTDIEPGNVYSFRAEK